MITAVVLYLKLEDVPDSVDSNENEVLGRVIVFIEKFNQHVETAGADKHLQCQGGCLVHLPDESRSLETDLVGVLSSGELGDYGNTTDEAEILLQFNIIKNDLDAICQ
jgi:hypothetical protein